jgi:hypothetical protein
VNERFSVYEFLNHRAHVFGTWNISPLEASHKLHFQIPVFNETNVMVVRNLNMNAYHYALIAGPRFHINL